MSLWLAEQTGYIWPVVRRTYKGKINSSIKGKSFAFLVCFFVSLVKPIQQYTEIFWEQASSYVDY